MNQLTNFLTLSLAILTLNLGITPVYSQNQSSSSETIHISPEIIEESPVLQRWLQEIPDVWQDIKNDPSFRTRVRLGYSQFPSNNQQGGLNLGVEDIFIGKTGLTLRGEYYTSFTANRETVGADLQYYILPLGSYVNIAPVVGYRYLQTGNYSTDGVNLGLKLMLPLSRNGAADLSVTQSFVSAGGSNEVGITTFSVAYAFTPNFRLATDIQQQNSRGGKDSRVTVVFEWMP